MKLVTLILSLIVSCDADLDLEDLISRGYTCSLADETGETRHQPGVETVCDDGVCSQCVKTGQGIKPWLVRNNHLDIELRVRDLKHG